MDYINYTLEEFVTDEYFRKWVNNLLPNEDTFWEHWLNEHPHKTELINQARFVVKALAMDHSTVSDQRAEEKINQIITLTDDSQPEIRPLQKNYYWWKIAAIVLVSLGLGWYFTFNPETSLSTYDEIIAESKTPMAEKINNSDHPLKISLSDGSEITLQPNSSLSYPEKFSADRREVYLSGEGFFNIAKNPDRPFLVYAGEIVTRVLGTSFSVKAYDNDKDLVVQVVTGKVYVLSRKAKSESSLKQTEGAILTPNQMAIYTRSQDKLVKTLVNEPILVKSLDKEPADFNFNNAPVPEVLRILEKSYGVPIVFDEELLANCTLTAPLANESLYDKLNLICKVIRASFEVIDAQIIITSKGCE